MPRVVTLTTDFRLASPYVAAVKGVLLTACPAVSIVDLSHDIPPQDVTALGLFLRDSIPFFPARTIHIAVVDPEVGTHRAALLVEWRDQFLLTPDNGGWTLIGSEPDAVWTLNRPEYWRSPVSPTFHARDVFAPVAGSLANGTPPDALGARTDAWRRLHVPEPVECDGVWSGQVVSVDSFGNLITNLPPVDGRVRVGGTDVGRPVGTYGDRPPGSLIALISSSGWLEIAVVNGSAADRLGARRGTTVTVELANPPCFRLAAP